VEDLLLYWKESVRAWLWSGRLAVLLEESVQWKTGIDTGMNLCRGILALVLEEICAGEGLVVEWKTGCSIGRICPIEERL
jgi:hypothetical protein